MSSRRKECLDCCVLVRCLALVEASALERTRSIHRRHIAVETPDAFRHFRQSINPRCNIH